MGLKREREREREREKRRERKKEKTAVEEKKHSVSNVSSEQLYCRCFSIKPKSKKNWRIREQS